MVTKLKEKPKKTDGYDHILDEEEQAFEDALEAGEFVPMPEEEKKRLEELIDKGRKSKTINLRIQQFELDRIKILADKEGLPYQTFISSILHKYITNQLMDKKDILESVALLKNSVR